MQKEYSAAISMFILGIDPGSSVTAYGLIDSKTKQSEYGFIKLKKQLTHEDKIHKIFLYVKETIASHRVDSVAVENSFYALNVQSAMLLSQVRAAVIIAAKENSIGICQYLPRQVKQAVCGYGAATKEQIRFVVEKTLNIHLNKQPLDVSDALAVALTHIYMSKS